MLRPTTKLLLGTGALLAALPAQALIITLQANLTRDQEPPSVGGNQPTLTCPPAQYPCPPVGPPHGGIDPRPTSSGTGTFVLITTAGSEGMSMTITVNNIDVGGPGINGGAITAGGGTQTPNDANDDLVAAHIHVGAGIPGVSNSPVRWGFWGSPFNNTDNDGAMALSAGVGGTFTGEWDALEGNSTTLLAQIPDILAGRAYVNYHTGQFPGGEIRGQLLVVSVVPEPGTLALLGIAALGFLGLRRRRT